MNNWFMKKLMRRTIDSDNDDPTEAEILCGLNDFNVQCIISTEKNNKRKSVFFKSEVCLI